MPNFSGTWTARQQMQARGASTWPAPPGAPTIGTATAGTSNCASITFTAPGCTGYPSGGITGYRVISTPGCFSNTGASSPVVVSGLTLGTSYTFKAQATNSSGYGSLSAASNSITATIATSAAYTTAGTYSWVAPTGVTSVAVVTVGGGGHGGQQNGCPCYPRARGGGGGGALAYGNAISVTPGSSYTVVVGAGGQTNNASGGQSYFNTTATVRANGGTGGTAGSFTGGAGGTVGAGTGGAGGKGGNGCGNANCAGAGGGGAGGYAGAGGESAGAGSQSYGASGGTGGAGGGGSNGSWPSSQGGGGGGGVGIFGQGTSGACIPFGGSGGIGGYGGSSGTNGTSGTSTTAGGQGGTYGGGGGSTIRSATWQGNVGGGGAVRIVWCVSGIRGTPSFPSTNVGA